MKIAIFTDIDWETDGQKVSLPKKCEIEVCNSMSLEDLQMDGADILSNKYGWLINGFNVKIKK